MSEENLNSALAGVDARKRATLTRLLAGTAFVAPVVASYAIDALAISKAQALTANGSGIAASDRRLKTAIKRLATLSCGLGLYRFKYLWSDTEYVGVMAQEVRELMPRAVVAGPDGFLRVDYAMLGLEMQTYADWQKCEALRAPAIAA
ncbi:MAG TPA: tail fiber domain-containing protein [Xanthobacteraceae bacterium]|nr:tail fiber domain-containing protein [Xanthobacteraceae bacterium]